MIGFYNKLKMGIDMGMIWPAPPPRPVREHVEPPQPWPTPESVGKKFDGDKPMMSLVEPKFIEGIANVLTSGAKKYAPGNWKIVDDAEFRYKNALLRHLFAYLDGEQNDPETGQSHLYHVGCNLMFLDYFDRNK